LLSGLAYRTRCDAVNHLATRGWAYLRVAIYRYSLVALDWSRWIGRARSGGQ